MTADAEVHDNRTGWVARHIKRYVESNGERGHEWKPGVYTLLLTTRGRHSGKWRRTPLIYGRDGDAYVVVASSGGGPANPGWYHNLVEQPEVVVQVAADTFTADARVAAGDERTRLWRTMASIWPDYDRYQRRTDREIPVVVLEPA